MITVTFVLGVLVIAAWWVSEEEPDSGFAGDPVSYEPDLSPDADIDEFSDRMEDRELRYHNGWEPGDRP